MYTVVEGKHVTEVYIETIWQGLLVDQLAKSLSFAWTTTSFDDWPTAVSSLI